MSTEEVLIGIASVVILGIGCQWVARRLGMPSLLLLLPAGLIAGDVLGLVQPREMLGDALFPVISVLVGLLLFQAGLGLRFADLPKKARRSVWRLVLIGGTITFAAATGLLFTLLPIEPEVAFLMGAILVVSGPTVVTPLLRTMRPQSPLGAILNWESTTLDPIGVIGAVAVLNVIISAGNDHASPLAYMALRVGWGALIGLIAAVLLVGTLRAFLVTDDMEASVAILFAIAAFTAAESLLSEAGLVATVVLGLVIANQGLVATRRIHGFGETLDVLIVGSLFILLGALVTVNSLVDNWLAIMGIVLGLVLVVRPVAATISLLGGHLNWRQRVLIGWVDPRGIVAAASAAQFSAVLAVAGFNTDLMLPVIFGVVFGTGLIYGLTASFVGKRLHVVEPPPNGVAFLGVDDWTLILARELRGRDVPVSFITDRPLDGADLNFPHVSLHATGGELEEVLSGNRLAWMVVVAEPTGAVQMMTALGVEHFGRSHVVMTSLGGHDGSGISSGVVGVREYVPGYSAHDLDELMRSGGRVVELSSMNQPRSVPLAVIQAGRNVDFAPKARKVPKEAVIVGMVWDEDHSRERDSGRDSAQSE